MALVEEEAEADADMVGREGRNGREDGNNNDKVKASDNSMHNDKFEFKAKTIKFTMIDCLVLLNITLIDSVLLCLHSSRF